MIKVFLLALILVLFTACGEGVLADGTLPENVIEIDDHAFATRVQDILLDAENYVGRAIRYEGIFWRFPIPDAHVDMVFRLMASCCSTLEIGFEVYLNDIEIPPNDTWVEVLGILEPFEYRGQTFFRLNVLTLEERPERGVDFIFN